MKRMSITLACCLVAFETAITPNVASAQYLAERLVPPQQVALPPVPSVQQPVDARVFGAEKPRSHMWALPFGAFPGAPTALATEQRPGNWQRPVLDLPSLSSDSDPARPAFPLQPTSSRAHAPAPNPAQSPQLARFSLASEPPVLAGDDPTHGPAFALMTVAVPLATPNSIPLLRLSIPDPFEQIRAIRLTVAPADGDDPATVQDRPPLSKLPMVEPPK